MTPKEAQKALEKLNWQPGAESFRKRSAEDQKVIREATTILSKSRKAYKPPTKKAAKTVEKTGDE